MDVYLAPASIENLNKSIIGSIDNKVLKKYLNEREWKEIGKIYKGKEIKCWGMNCGSGKYQTYFNDFNYGDYIIFTPKGSGKFKYIGRIVYKIFNEKLGEILWKFKGDKENGSWKYIMFIEDVKEVDIDKKKLLVLLGYKPNYYVYGLTKLNEYKNDLFFKSISEINVNEVLFNINNEDINRLLCEYLNNKVIGTVDKTIPKFYKKNKDENVKNKINKAEKRVSVRNAKIIGLLGEKVVYETLLSKNSELLDKLNIKQEEIISIEWYNEVINLFNESSYIKTDYSIGKGHDINIITTNKEIFIEVKSSYGASYQISTTSNEMKVMKKHRDYYILIVENLRNIFMKKEPTIRIIESFGHNIPNEILSSISSINIYTNSNLIKHHTIF